MKSLNNIDPKDLASKKARIFGIFVSVIEWYDYALYAYLTNIISRLYFPETDRIAGLISSYIVFAFGFFARPIGSWVFGYIGDYYSRKKALYWSLLLMSVTTIMMIFLPTYSQIGVFAPIGLTLIRLLQGVAVGGNYGGTYVFSIENSPIGRRGLTGGWTGFGTFLGFLIGSIVCTLISGIYNEQQMLDFAWRFPFILGIFSLFLAFWLDLEIKDKKRNLKKQPAMALFESINILMKNNFNKILRAICLVLLDAIGIYLLFFFYKHYMEEIIGISIEDAYKIHTIGMIVMLVMTVFFGYISDKIGRKPILYFVALSFILIPFWGFNYASNDFTSSLIVQSLFAVVMGACYGSLPAFIVEMFPKSIRYSASSLVFNISMCFFGGTSIMFALWLLKTTNTINSVATYLAIVGVMVIFALYGIEDKYNKPID